MANFLFTLGKGDVESATRWFQLAKVAHSKGHAVNIFLHEDGVPQSCIKNMAKSV